MPGQRSCYRKPKLKGFVPFQDAVLLKTSVVPASERGSNAWCSNIGLTSFCVAQRPFQLNLRMHGPGLDPRSSRG